MYTLTLFITSYISKSTTVRTQFLSQYGSLLKNNTGDNQSRLANFVEQSPVSAWKNALLKID